MSAESDQIGALAVFSVAAMVLMFFLGAQAGWLAAKLHSWLTAQRRPENVIKP